MSHRHCTFWKDEEDYILTKCSDNECNCSLFHCPFCTINVSKPVKQCKLKKHLYKSHWSLRVPFQDIFIVKCCQDCRPEGSTSHYHCPICYQSIIKRNNFLIHLESHQKPSNLKKRKQESLNAKEKNH